MGKITDVTRQKKKETRVSIFVDGEFVCGLDELTFAQSRIAIGDEIEIDELMEICKESEKRTAFDKAVKYIAYRQRTKKEVRTHLREKGYLPQSVDYAVDKLCEYGYLDDYRFCREYVAVYASRVGVKKIRMDMMRLGADKNAIDEALNAIEEQEDAAYKTAQKYVRTHKNFNAMKLKAYLYSRGFNGDDISSATQRICDEIGEDSDDDYE
ncbi:MAG: RecX family transcriptional regulator [Clostridia bacterium]|nr:RecX family transcriptional regulator [Clostridia bacterium]